MSRRRAAALGLVALAIAGCNGERPPADTAHAADSATAPAAAPVPPPPVSRFDVPLDYDFTPVMGIVERVVPRTFGSLDSVRTAGTDQRKHYAFVATRDSFTTFAKGAEVHLRTTLSYQARGFYKPLVGPTLSAGCGNETVQPQIVLELVTPLTLSPNWHLRSAADLERLAPATDSAKDRCSVSILSYDVTDRVVEAARKALTDHLADIDKKIAAVDLSARAAGWWKSLNQPIRLTDGVWLVLHPQQIRLGDVTGDRHTLTVRAGLDAFPAIVTGAEPHPAAPPLPPLAKATPGSGFRILLEGTVDYITASHALTEALRGKTVTQAGRSVTVQSVLAMPDTAGRLTLAVSFTGDAKGTLRLVGTPKYLRQAGMIVVPDLNYDLKTNNDLINAYAWLRSDALLKLLRERAAVPVAPVLDRGKSLLVNGLNRTIGGVMTLSAKVDSVSVVGLRVTKPGLLVNAGAWGRARVTVRQKR
ncbi:MAG: hypothetical protein JWM41_4308 [Gemmatimonadetes bacterium]|nr:hypothetical protein [Gemmatimonadota bacterium]